jgi:hypothetical protein
MICDHLPICGASCAGDEIAPGVSPGPAVAGIVAPTGDSGADKFAGLRTALTLLSPSDAY